MKNATSYPEALAAVIAAGDKIIRRRHWGRRFVCLVPQRDGPPLGGLAGGDRVMEAVASRVREMRGMLMLVEMSGGGQHTTPWAATSDDSLSDDWDILEDADIRIMAHEWDMQDVLSSPWSGEQPSSAARTRLGTLASSASAILHEMGIQAEGRSHPLGPTDEEYAAGRMEVPLGIHTGSGSRLLLSITGDSYDLREVRDDGATLLRSVGRGRLREELGRWERLVEKRCGKDFYLTTYTVSVVSKQPIPEHLEPSITALMADAALATTCRREGDLCVGLDEAARALSVDPAAMANAALEGGVE